MSWKCLQRMKKFDIKTNFIVMSSFNGKRWKDGKADNILQLCRSYLWVLQWKSTFNVPHGQVELSFHRAPFMSSLGKALGKEFCFLSHAKEDEWIRDVWGQSFMYMKNGKTSKSVWFVVTKCCSDELSRKPRYFYNIIKYLIAETMDMCTPQKVTKPVGG